MNRREAEALARLLDGGGTAGRSVPDDVADLAELARAIEAGAVRPRADFRSDLRAMLMAEAAVGRPSTWRTRVRDFAGDALAGMRTTTRGATLTGLAALVAIAVLAGATHVAVPGDLLHAVKVGLEDQGIARAETASEQGQLLLEAAARRIHEAERVSAARPERSGLALDAADARVRAGSQALLRALIRFGDPAASVTLRSFTAQYRSRVRSLAAADEAGTAAAALLTTFDRIDRRLDAIAMGCCPRAPAVPAAGQFDLTLIPPASEPFVACPCETRAQRNTERRPSRLR